MNLTISGHHLEVTPALRGYVTSKLERISRHFDQVVDINVLLTVEKLAEKERRQKAEVTLHVKGKDIYVEQAHEDLYAAIDQLMSKSVIFFGAGPVLARSVGFIFGTITAYLINRRWAFQAQPSMRRFLMSAKKASVCCPASPACTR